MFQIFLLITFSPLIALVLWKSIPQISYVYIVTLFIGLVHLWILWLFRSHKLMALSSLIYSLNVVVAGIGVWINQNTWIDSQLSFQPFTGFKLFAIVVAFQAPPLRKVGWFCLIFLLLTPGLQYFLWPDWKRNLVGVQETWTTFLVVTFAGILYEQRLQFQKISERRFRLEASEKELKKYAHLLLGARHLLNSPLQVIHSTTELILIKHPETKPLVDRMQNSFISIAAINHHLAISESRIQWKEVQLPNNLEELKSEVDSIFPKL
ncbi:MAG: hypothetical protein ACAH59_07285 [Pseudobdellovibrionaceae bacterium]